MTKLHLAGRGMGATKVKKKKGGGGGNNNRAKRSGFGGGGGTKFDVSKAFIKSEKAYDELLIEAAKNFDNNDPIDEIAAEYMITARVTREVSNNIGGTASLLDWVPVAQLCLIKSSSDDDAYNQDERDFKRILTAISYYCREIYYVATLGASIFRSTPRNMIEYSVEPIDSFYKFVYEDVIEGKKHYETNEDTMLMTKAKARNVLGLRKDCNDATLIKSAYKKQSFKLHPDRLIGDDLSEEELRLASLEYSQVRTAYESLSSGVRGSFSSDGREKSWYESLGGRSRTDFSGSLKLLSLEEAKTEFIEGGFKAAITGLNPETVMAFVMRNQEAFK